MPNPLKMIHDELGLWPKWLLPSEAVYNVLRHLMLPGEPRLYVNHADGRRTASLSNSESAAGWSTGASLESMFIWKWVRKDEVLTRAAISTITVYEITDKGREAVAQVDAYKGFEALLRRELPKIVDVNYDSVGLPKDYKRTKGR